MLLENGYVEIVGRIKDIIIRGGENIDPKDVEEVLIKHPEIIDVQVYITFILSEVVFPNHYEHYCFSFFRCTE